MSEKLKKINLPHQINNVKTFQVMIKNNIFITYIAKNCGTKRCGPDQKVKKYYMKFKVGTFLKFLLLGEGRKSFGKLHNSTTDN